MSYPSQRSPDVQAKYDEKRQKLIARYGDNLPCAFCDEITDRVILRHMDTMYLIENDYPYNTFLGLNVLRHLLIIPKRHQPFIRDLSEVEQQEYWRVTGEYQANGFAVFTRSPRDETASAPAHLHTHLMLFEASTSTDSC